jgi:hypothetical protein
MTAFNEGMSRRAWAPEEEAMLGRDTAPQVAVNNSGAVRALLCGACNMGIGQLKDDPALLHRAADYIERHRLRVVAGERRVI